MTCVLNKAERSLTQDVQGCCTLSYGKHFLEVRVDSKIRNKAYYGQLHKPIIQLFIIIFMCNILYTVACSILLDDWWCTFVETSIPINIVIASTSLDNRNVSTSLQSNMQLIIDQTQTIKWHMSTFNKINIKN
jgi:hypothetical protein